jgi:hypothetical protein
MALISPGVEVSVIDESQYIPSAVNTVPYFVVATAQNKVSGDGVSLAAGTTTANANKTYLITSQRDLVATFGVPFFYNTTSGTPINGYELNEYGLLAAYSALGVTNRAYVQRVDVDLNELSASLNRPTGSAANGSYWLDVSNTRWGIAEWSQEVRSFVVRTPLVIDSPEQVDDSAVPLDSVGNIGDYAVVVLDSKNPGYYKNKSNEWVLIGSQDWQQSWPTLQSRYSPASLVAGNSVDINGTVVTVPASTNNTVAGLAGKIVEAAIDGVTAAAVNGRLEIYVNSSAAEGAGTVTIAQPEGSTVLTQLGITAGTYYAPVYTAGYSYQIPRWRATDTQPRPTGSVWNNVSTVNNGLSISLKKYSSSVDLWVPQTCPAYQDDIAAINAIDAAGGGRFIPVGTTFVQFRANDLASDPNASFGFELFERVAFGKTIVTGSVTPGAFSEEGSQFELTASGVSSTATQTGTVTITGTTVESFLAAVSQAAVPHVTASVDNAGRVVLTHELGGVIVVKTLGDPAVDPLTNAGFTANTSKCRVSSTDPDAIVLSNFVGSPLFSYTASDTEPGQDPADGRLWYYSTASEVDIMIQDNGAWKGYRNVDNDVRGFDLTDTNATGPIVAAAAPTTQSDANQSPLVQGDLWIDSSDLENYPKIYRWEVINTVGQWVSVDSTDQVTENGVLFADARWASNGTTDPVADALPSIAQLTTSNYTDVDAPDPALYPQGMLLWNMRRSGYNIKRFQRNYFTEANFPDAKPLPAVSNAWVTASGLKADGSMYSGRSAQRRMVVAAMKAGIDQSLAAREEQNQFNIIATPGYPELTPNMIALSNERNNTLFVVGDTPMRLSNSGNDLVEWATNNGGLGLPTEDGNIATSNFAASFYPSCLTNDLNGNQVVAPPSHMMVRTILRSDAVSYPWLAPAGTRRGVVDNASAIGYIDAATGEFQQIGVSQAQRDILYERNVNPITFIPGVGIVNFGNKTSTVTTTALDRINVARLVAFLRGRLEEVGKLFLFEPNDEITRREIANLCSSLMIDLVSKRAIYDYLVVCDLSNNTPARIDRNELWVDIAIEPVKAAEFIYIPLRVKNTGEISSGT